MGKKSKRNRPNNSNRKDQRNGAGAPIPPPALRGGANNNDAAATVETKDNLRFEDPYVEEYVEEDDVEAADDDEEWEDDGHRQGGGSGTAGAGAGADVEIIQSWNPLTGEPLRPGQELEMDPTAYKMHHALSAEWPALTFDFIRDDRGEARTRFPHSLQLAVGSQADRPENNQLTVMKLSDLARIQVETDDDILGDELPDSSNNNNDDDDDDEDSDSDDEIDLDPVVEHYSIKHYGGVNRVRVMPQKPSIVATWSDAGAINLFNVDPVLQRFSLGENRKQVMSSTTTMDSIPTKPFYSYSNQQNVEGYAMDWSSVKAGSFVTGDCSGLIHLWTPRPDGSYQVEPSYDPINTSRPGTDKSIEDLQWSPTEPTVFASGECGGYVRIFDTRAPNRAMLCHKVHHASGADVNVLSWNALVANLLATGGDDGVLSVWDLRHFSASSSNNSSSNDGDESGGGGVKPLARFTPHKTPITSLEWHPTDESMLAVSDDHGTYIYDLSVEEDGAVMGGGGQPKSDDNTTNTDHDGPHDVPPQLLFVHSGSQQYKELHWHPQITSCLMTTALSGFSVFIPSNL